MNYIQETTKIALKSILTHNYFDYSKFKQLVALNKVILDQEKEAIFSIQHCVNYNVMSEEYLIWFFQEILNVFGYTRSEIITIKTIDLEEKIITESNIQVKHESFLTRIFKRI